MIEKPPLIQGSGTENRSKSASHLQTIEKPPIVRSASARNVSNPPDIFLLSISTPIWDRRVRRLADSHTFRNPSVIMTGGNSYVSKLMAEPRAKLSRIPPQNERGPATRSETNEKPPLKRRNHPAAIPALNHGEPTGTGCRPGNKTRPRPQSNQEPPLHSTASISANEAHGAALIRTAPSNLIFRATP